MEYKNPQKQRKKSNPIKKLKCGDSFIPYIELLNFSKEKKDDFCRHKFLPLIFGKEVTTKIYSHNDVIYTQRLNDRPNDLIGINSYICLYESDIYNCTKEDLGIVCIDESNCIEYDNGIVRIYLLGFCKRNELKQQILTKITTSKKKNEMMKIQGVVPTSDFYIISITNLTRNPTTAPKQIEIGSNTLNVELKPSNPKKILLMRQEPSVYLYIMNGDHLGYSESNQMLDLENECFRRLELLCKISINLTVGISNYARTASKMLEDRRVMHTLLLVMCWNKTYREWYVSNEIAYINIICDSMLDVEDAELNIIFNRLKNRIQLDQNHFDRNEFKKKLCHIQYTRLNHVMDCWTKQIEVVENNPKILQNLTTKLYTFLKKKQDLSEMMVTL